MSREIWKARKKDEEKARELARELPILPLTASLILNRGIEDISEAKKFLFPKLSYLNDPFQLEEMELAVARLREAIIEKEPIFLQGDYDVDGICATALLAKILVSLGGRVFCYIPNRQREGHGISDYAVKKAIELRAGLFVTVDCGSSSHAQVEKLNGNGIDVIITDHHEMPERPSALALVNPKFSDSYPFQALAGVGVAFKVGQALISSFGKSLGPLYEKLDLVALGTIADLASLLGENRILVKFGLEKLGTIPSNGLDMLKKFTGLNGYVDSHKVSFILAPRLNAPGRISSPLKALELLLTEDNNKKEALCRELEKMNRERRSLETKILMEIEEDLSSLDLERELVIVLKGENWHRGLLGLVASKLVELYQRPVFVLSKYGDKVKGSGRSIPSFNIYKAVQEISHLLINYGGHNSAVGVEMEEGNFYPFKEHINEIASKYLSLDELRPKQEAEAILTFQEISFRLAQEISLLAPFGIDNPQPLFISKDVEVKGVNSFPNGRYAVLTLQQNGTELICLSPVKLLEGLPHRCSIIYSLDVDKDSSQPLLLLKGWSEEDNIIVSEEKRPYLGQLLLWEDLF
ncbi:single-stranded-DNA-specific exonuclease RecJ [bacterium]|nr:single-stranded-DNA-specific exonuclease RecJ [bacterium]